MATEPGMTFHQAAMQNTWPFSINPRNPATCPRKDELRSHADTPGRQTKKSRGLAAAGCC